MLNSGRGNGDTLPPLFRKKALVFIFVFLFILLAGAWFFLAGRGGAKKLVVECTGRERVEFPLERDALYLVRNGEIQSLEGEPEELTAKLEGLSDYNILQVEKGVVSCIRSDCDNQICVHTAPLKGEGYEVPIVCLPHGMAVHLE